MRTLNMRKNETPGFLITFCGLDGCGKTTMMKRLITELEKEHAIFVTKQPTNVVIPRFSEPIWTALITMRLIIAVFPFSQLVTVCNT